jgi:hypothetical protein
MEQLPAAIYRQFIEASEGLSQQMAVYVKPLCAAILRCNSKGKLPP